MSTRSISNAGIKLSPHLYTGTSIIANKRKLNALVRITLNRMSDMYTNSFNKIRVYAQTTALQGELVGWIQPARYEGYTALQSSSKSTCLQLLDKNLGLLLALYYIGLPIPSAQLLERCFLYFDDAS